jgi:hypothetical protein
MPDSAALSVEFVETEKQIPDDLWAACFTPQQEGRWWCRLVENAGLEKQFRIFYALVRQNGEPAGIVPMFTMELPLDFIVPEPLIPLLAGIGKLFPNLSQPQILFVGSPCADEGAIGFLPSVDRRAALLCVQEAIEKEAPRRGAGLVLWKDFPQSYGDDFAWLAERKGMFSMTSFPGAEIDLAGGKEGYFAAMSSSRRYNLRRKLKQSAANFDAAVEVVQQPDDAMLDAVLALFNQTRTKATTEFEHLERDFFERAAQEPNAYFILLRDRASGNVVAFMLCFDLGGRVVNKYIGLDYSYSSKAFLLFRLIDVAMDWALTRGARVFQSGQTGYSAKIEQGHRLVPLTIYGKHFNPVFHWIGTQVTRRIRWATLDDDLAIYVKAHPELN